MFEWDLIDVWRIFNPELKRYHWRCRKPEIKCRLDYFLTSSSIVNKTEKACIFYPGFWTNHSLRLQTSIYFTILYHIASLPFKTYLQKFDKLDYHRYMLLCLAISVSSVFICWSIGIFSRYSHHFELMSKNALKCVINST